MAERPSDKPATAAADESRLHAPMDAGRTRIDASWLPFAPGTRSPLPAVADRIADLRQPEVAGWHPIAGAHASRWRLPNYAQTALDPDGRRLLIVTHRGRTIELDLATGRTIAEYAVPAMLPAGVREQDEEARPDTPHVHPGATLAGLYRILRVNDGTGRIEYLSGGRVTHTTPFRLPTQPGRPPILSQDGRRLVAVRDIGSSRSLDVLPLSDTPLGWAESARSRQTYPLSAEPWELASGTAIPLPDGSFGLLRFGANGSIAIWYAGRDERETLIDKVDGPAWSHEPRVTPSADGRWIAISVLIASEEFAAEDGGAGADGLMPENLVGTRFTGRHLWLLDRIGRTTPISRRLGEAEQVIGVDGSGVVWTVYDQRLRRHTAEGCWTAAEASAGWQHLFVDDETVLTTRSNWPPLGDEPARPSDADELRFGERLLQWDLAGDRMRLVARGEGRLHVDIARGANRIAVASNGTWSIRDASPPPEEGMWRDSTVDGPEATRIKGPFAMEGEGEHPPIVALTAESSGRYVSWLMRSRYQGRRLREGVEVVVAESRDGTRRYSAILSRAEFSPVFTHDSRFAIVPASGGGAIRIGIEDPDSLRATRLPVSGISLVVPIDGASAEGTYVWVRYNAGLGDRSAVIEVRGNRVVRDAALRIPSMTAITAAIPVLGRLPSLGHDELDGASEPEAGPEGGILLSLYPSRLAMIDLRTLQLETGLPARDDGALPALPGEIRVGTRDPIRAVTLSPSGRRFAMVVGDVLWVFAPHDRTAGDPT